MTIGCYILNNTKSNKKYVGQSIHIERRIRQHSDAISKNVIHKAINSVGFNNFSINIWECKKEDLDELEEFLISEIGTLVPNGYNVSIGGYGLRGVVKTEEHKRKIGIANSGKVMSETTKEKLRQSNLGRSPSNKGKTQTLTPEQKAKHRLAMDKLKKPKKVRMTREESAKFMSENYSGVNHSQYGKQKSEETKAKISKKLLGNVAWNKGKPMTEESKRKLSESQKARLAKKKEPK
jgi:group I intron endonuclease